MFERKQNKPETAGPAEAGDSTPAPPVPTKTKRTGSGAKAMIGSKVKITGDIESAEDLLIEGEVNGTVKLAENELVVGASGRVHADVEAKVIRIEGEVHGDITGRERVVITDSGTVEGNVNAPRVVLEDGGRFKGSIDMGGARDTAAAKPAPKPEPAQAAPAEKKASDLPGASKAG